MFYCVCQVGRRILEFLAKKCFFYQIKSLDIRNHKLLQRYTVNFGMLTYQVVAINQSVKVW